MKLVADESIDKQIVDCLREHGHSVSFVAETSPSLDDDAVLARANEQQAPLLTSDKDFGELVFRQELVSHGVLLVRLAGLLSETKARIVAAAIGEHEQELRGNFAVVAPGAVRIRSRTK